LVRSFDRVRSPFLYHDIRVHLAERAMFNRA
jgi:hypothetical protein